MSRQIHSSDAQEAPPVAVMFQMITGFWLSRAIYVAAKLGIADFVKQGPRTVAELAAETGTHAPSLYRVLRALASAGIFVEDESGRFASTPLAATLESDTPGTLRSFATVELGEDHYLAWTDVLHSVKTGEIAFDHHFGMNIWQFYAENTENGTLFENAMSNTTRAINEALINSYDFSSFKKIVDIGGGYGDLLASILATCPETKGVLFDSPHVIEAARRREVASKFAARLEMVGGNFFESVTGGGDAYVLKWIIHDWNEEQSQTILKNCRRAIAENGKLLLVESVIPVGNTPFFGKFMDLNMLVMTGGRERTESEYRELYKAAGFKLTRIIATPSPFSLIEGVPD